jgi:mRNA interferase MazF
VIRGEIYLVDLQPRSGSEQQGHRPAIIVSNNTFNQASSWHSIIIVPVSTSQTQRQRGPTAVPLPQGSGGLTQDSVALCHQLTTLDRGKFVRRLGALRPDLMSQLEAGIKVALQMA